MDCLCHRCLTRVNNQTFGLHWCEAHQPALPSSGETGGKRQRRRKRGERKRYKGKEKEEDDFFLNKGNNGHLCFTVDQAAKDKRITEQ